MCEREGDETDESSLGNLWEERGKGWGCKRKKRGVEEGEREPLRKMGETEGERGERRRQEADEGLFGFRCS